MSESKRLIVLIHGLSNRRHKLNDVIELTKQQFPGVDPDGLSSDVEKRTAVNHIVSKDWPHNHLLSSTRMAEITLSIINMIDSLYEKYKYEEIILVGYSTGATLARRVLIEAFGAADSPKEGFVQTAKTRHEAELMRTKKRNWARIVSRLVLISGVGRGWSLNYVTSRFDRLMQTFGAFIGAMFPLGLNDIRLGAPFVVQTRLRWLQVKGLIKENCKVFQLVGSIDGTVPPVDGIDQFQEDGKFYKLLQLPGTDHRNSVSLNVDDKNEHNRAFAVIRKRILAEVITGAVSDQILNKYEITSSHLSNSPNEADNLTSDVVFIIHGIRDFGYWTQKIAAYIRRDAEQVESSSVSHKPENYSDDRKYVILTPSYGYFAILPFLLWWIRRAKLEWFMDQYVNAKIIFPNARFHFVGHSNGTYLCAAALDRYPMVEFDRIVFAGSVVRQDFNWGARLKEKRCNKVLNVIATSDVVVALFPNAFRHRCLSLFDLGGAGHDGFCQPYIAGSFEQLRNQSYPYVRGGHSAGRAEALWDDISKFVVTGDFPKTNKEEFASSQSQWMKTLGWMSTPLILFMLYISVYFFVFLLAPFVPEKTKLIALLCSSAGLPVTLGMMLSLVLVFLTFLICAKISNMAANLYFFSALLCCVPLVFYFYGDPAIVGLCKAYITPKGAGASTVELIFLVIYFFSFGWLARRF